jgi:hypothetical protein
MANRSSSTDACSDVGCALSPLIQSSAEQWLSDATASELLAASSVHVGDTPNTVSYHFVGI